jgi:hypothetical protein
MLLSAVAELIPFDIEVAEAAINENIFILRKRLGASGTFLAR